VHRLLGKIKITEQADQSCQDDEDDSANQLRRINLAKGGSIGGSILAERCKVPQVVTLKSGQQTAASLTQNRLTQNRQCTHLSFVQAQPYRVALELRAIGKLNHKSEAVRIRLRGFEAVMRWVVVTHVVYTSQSRALTTAAQKSSSSITSAPVGLGRALHMTTTTWAAGFM
jgi:hypothetical protein